MPASVSRIIILLLLFMFADKGGAQVFWTEDFASGETGWHLNQTLGGKASNANFFKLDQGEDGGITQKISAGTDPSFAVDDITLSAASCDLQIYAHGTDPSCVTPCNGSAIVDVAGGTAPYNYSWSNGAATQSVSGLCAGTYTVTVTDANGCSTSSVVSAPGCFQLQAILVNSCFPTDEENEEMVFFKVGSNPLNTSGLTVTWPNASNSWRGICTNPAYLAAANATITGGGVLLPLPGNGILPTNANVVLITGNALTSPVADFSDLTETLYVIFQCSGNSQGHFGNDAKPSNPLILDFGSGCSESAVYSILQPEKNGDYVLYSYGGKPTYLNYGCKIPFAIQSSQVVLNPGTPVNVNVSVDKPTLCNAGDVATLSATGAGSYIWSPSVGLSATTGATVTANPTVTTTYTVTGTLNGCTGSANVTVWVLQNPTLQPAVPCAGAATTFTAGNGALYEFSLNGTSQGAPSVTNTFTSGALLAGDQVCVKIFPTTPFVYDGLLTEPEWGPPLATSSGGPPSSSFGENRIDAIYMKNLNGTLNVAIAGTEEDGTTQQFNNRILLFIDSKSGGYNNLEDWEDRSGLPTNTDGIKNLKGEDGNAIVFDAGFEPDYILAMNRANNGGQTYYDLYDMAGTINQFLGAGPNPAQFGFQPNARVGDFTKGFEFAFPLSAIGSPTGSIKLFAMLVNDPGTGNATTVSNQFLTSAGTVQTNNFGNGAINFNNEPPNPITYNLEALCYSETCLTVQPVIDPVFDPIGPFCEGDLLPPSTLPSTDKNGLTGSWSGTPSTDNPGDFNFTFTPNDPCANSKTITITIKPLPTTTNIFHD